jgi:hypothetical protein
MSVVPKDILYKQPLKKYLSSIVPDSIEFRVLLEEGGGQIECTFGEVIVASLMISVAGSKVPVSSHLQLV